MRWLLTRATVGLSEARCLHADFAKVQPSQVSTQPPIQNSREDHTVLQVDKYKKHTHTRQRCYEELIYLPVLSRLHCLQQRQRRHQEHQEPELNLEAQKLRKKLPLVDGQHRYL